MSDTIDGTTQAEEPVVGRRAFSGHETGQFSVNAVTESGEEVRTFGRGESIYAHRKAERGYEGFWDQVHIGQFLRARQFGPQTHAESRALDSAAAGAAIPSPLRDQVVDDVKEASLLGRTGLRMIPMESNTLDIARFESVPGSSWVAEGSSNWGSTDPTIGSVTFNAHTNRVRVDVTRETFDDSVGLEDALRRSFVQSLTESLNDGIMIGSTSSTDVPVGLSKTTEINTTAFGGTTSGVAPGASSAQWGEVLRARQAVRDRQATPGPLEIVTSPRVFRQFFSLKDGNNQPIQRPDVISDLRITESVASPTTLSSTNGAAGAEMLLGDLSAAGVGMRLDPEIRVIDAELGDTWSFRFVGALRADVQVIRPEPLQRLRPITT